MLWGVKLYKSCIYINMDILIMEMYLCISPKSGENYLKHQFNLQKIAEIHFEVQQFVINKNSN